MHIHRTLVTATGTAAAVTAMLGAALTSPSAGATTRSDAASEASDPGARAPSQRVIARGLDNPRQVSVTASGRLLVAQAGHGRWDGGNCRVAGGGGLDGFCRGLTGRATTMGALGRRRARVLDRLPSTREASNSLTFGINGVDRTPQGRLFATISSKAWEQVSSGSVRRFNGKLVRGTKAGRIRVVARPTAFGRRHGLLGAQEVSEPTDLVALRRKVLFLDESAGVVLRYRQGRLGVWYRPAQLGDPANRQMPQSMSLGADGHVYVVVGELGGMEARVDELTTTGRLVARHVGLPRVQSATATADGRVWIAVEQDGIVRQARAGSGVPQWSVPDPGSLTARGNVLYATAYSTHTRRPFFPGEVPGQLRRLVPGS
ncbi:hypothetical protein [Mumia sp. DW29H23]|uniref:hypothetical protein n=1 Tax=Mumia sp. DW29H23 TaxID=3421241 RepID=UPI003D69B62A